MIEFLIKSSISLVVFLGFYHLILEREKMHQFNRFYLLSSIVISLVIPFITFEIIKIVPAVQEVNPAMPQFPTTFEKITPETLDYAPIVLWGLYGIITFTLLLRFGKNIWKLLSKSNSNPVVKYQNARLILVDEKTLPHTFLNSIFINSDDYNNRNIEEELYTHELVHVNQKHTLDILFIEFLKVIFWFNPIYIFYKKAIQLNHEFLADEEIVKTYNNIPFYQNLLLQKSSENQTIYLASNLNYLVTKKRLLMMTKSTSKHIAFLKKIAIVPILAGLVFFICFKVVAQEKVTTTTNQKLVTETDKDKIRDSYYAGVRVILKDKRKGIEINKIYEELTLEQKRIYMDWVPDMIIEKEVPQPLFIKLTTKNNAVWINGKISTKEEIKKYKRTDFTYYTYSFVHKNARTKRFPQEYQYTLYTKEFFDKNLKTSHLHFGNDTIKMVISDWKKASKDKTLTILNSVKADTVVWYNNEEKNREYNLLINDPVKKDKNKVSEKQETDLYNLGDLTEKPEFEDGMTALFKYISAHFKIPEEVSKNKLKGKVYASFIIEKDGTLSNIKILKEMGYGTGKEAERVLKNSPKWKPGKINEKSVRTLYSLPIVIASE